MADYGIGEYLLAEAAGDAAIADMVGLSTADLIGAGTLEAGAGALTAAEAASAAGAAEGAGALTAADLIASGAVPNIGSTVASGAFDSAGFQGIDALGNQIIDPVTRAIQAGNMANTGMTVPNAFQGITELDAAQTADLMKNIDPRMIDMVQPVEDAANVTSRGVDLAGNGNTLQTQMDLSNRVGNINQVQDMMPAFNSGPVSAVATPGYLDQALALADKYKTPLITGAATAGIKSLLSGDKQKYGINPEATKPYSGPLSKFSYNPATYTPASNPAPNYYTPQYKRYVAGGMAKSDSMSDLMGSRDSIDKYLTEYQSDPASVHQKAKAGDYNAMIALNKINQTPNQNYATGGIAQLAVGGKLLRGQGDGMSDSIKANISGKRQARLADGEFVVPADVVSHLGNGSTDAGAKQLYSMMDKVRNARTGRKSQGRQITPQKYMPA